MPETDPPPSAIIRPMTAADAGPVLDIYRRGLETGHASFESTVPSWPQWDEKHHAFCRLVSEQGGLVVGWAALAPVSGRLCYSGVAEVSIYVHPQHKGRGIGGRLMGELIAESERHGIWTLFSSIFRENTATLRLHLRHGFREVGFRERIAQHDGRWRDTLILERRSKVVGV